MKAVLGILIAAVAPLAAQTEIVTGPAQGRAFPAVPLQAPSAPAGTASIEGVVTDSVTHQPIRKAAVALNGRTNLNAVTGLDGHFAFRQLTAGQYFVQAQSDRYPIGQFSFESGRQVSVSVAADEHKTDVSLTLTPGASLRGRIVDEDGNPMPQCTVSPMRYRPGDTAPAFVGGPSLQSDQKGEYRVENIAAGKYYLVARCFQNIPMPHAFVRRDALSSVPMLTYPSTFYPSAADLAGATRVSLTPGADLSGIDFQMTPVTGITLRGHVRPVLAGSFTQIRLQPTNHLLGPFRLQGSRTNQPNGEFQIPIVPPGSYELVAAAEADGRSYFAKVPVEVGATAPDPIDVLLQAVPQISGSVSFEGDTKVPAKNLRAMLLPLDQQPIGPPPQAVVQENGSFVINAPPGRFRLQINGTPGYLKSVTLGNQEVSASSLEIGPTPDPLHIVIGTKLAQVDATVTGIPSDATAVSGIIWSPDGDQQQSISVSPQGAATLSVPPGKYFACAISAAQPYILLQNREFKKAMESRCQSVEAVDGSRTSIQLPFIPADEIKRLADSLDADDPPAF